MSYQIIIKQKTTVTIDLTVDDLDLNAVIIAALKLDKADLNKS